VSNIPHKIVALVDLRSAAKYRLPAQISLSHPLFPLQTHQHLLPLRPMQRTPKSVVNPARSSTSRRNGGLAADATRSSVTSTEPSAILPPLAAKSLVDTAGIGSARSSLLAVATSAASLVGGKDWNEVLPPAMRRMRSLRTLDSQGLSGGPPLY
jgi:hypothetical protein